MNLQALDKLKPYLQTYSAKKGELLLRPGEIQRVLYFVRKGVQMSYYDTDSKLYVMAFTYPPDLCADPRSFTSQQPSDCFIECLSDSEFDSIGYERLQLLMAEHHELESLFRQLTEQLLSGVIQRHLELATLSIEERFRRFCHRSPHLLQLVPHKYLAAYLGINPTNFSKLYNSIKIS